MSFPGGNEPTSPPPPPGSEPWVGTTQVQPAFTPWAQPGPPRPPGKGGTSPVLVGVLAGVGVVLAVAVVALAVILLRGDGSSSSQVATATTASTAAPATAPSTPDVSTLSPPTLPPTSGTTAATSPPRPTAPPTSATPATPPPPPPPPPTTEQESTTVEPLVTADDAMTIAVHCVGGNWDHDVRQDVWETDFRYTNSGAGGEYHVYVRRSPGEEPWAVIMVVAIRDRVALDRNESWDASEMAIPYPRSCNEGIDGYLPPPF